MLEGREAQPHICCRCLLVEHAAPRSTDLVSAVRGGVGLGLAVGLCRNHFAKRKVFHTECKIPCFPFFQGKTLCGEKLGCLDSPAQEGKSIKMSPMLLAS